MFFLVSVLLIAFPTLVGIDWSFTSVHVSSVLVELLFSLLISLAKGIFLFSLLAFVYTCDNI